MDAELFVLTDDRPSFYPEIGTMQGMTVRADKAADGTLLTDLQRDTGMSWVPSSGMWFTALSLHTDAVNVTGDLAIDGGGPVPSPTGRPIPVHLGWPFWIALIGGAALLIREASRMRRRAERVRSTSRG